LYFALKLDPEGLNMRDYWELVKRRRKVEILA